MVGDIVESPFPFTDLSIAKIRPVLLLSDVGMGDWITCEITTRRSRRRGTIIIESSDFIYGGLPRPSAVRFDRLHAINNRVFHRTMGHLNDVKLQEILTAVRGIF